MIVLTVCFANFSSWHLTLFIFCLTLALKNLKLFCSLLHIVLQTKTILLRALHLQT